MSIRRALLYGPPRTSKTHFALYFSRYFTQAFSAGRSRCKTVQFHSSCSYEDFDRLVPRTTNAGLVYEPNAKTRRELCNTAKSDTEKRPHVLIIDEINQGSLAKIFGEPIFSLEYRDHGVTLSYSKEKFRIQSVLLGFQTSRLFGATFISDVSFSFAKRTGTFETIFRILPDESLSIFSTT